MLCDRARAEAAVAEEVLLPRADGRAVPAQAQVLRLGPVARIDMPALEL